MLKHKLKVAITISLLGALVGCESTTTPSVAPPLVDVASAENGPGELVSITPSAIKLNGRGFATTMSDGTVCLDAAAKDAQRTVGTYSGSFANCPSASYTLTVTQARDMAADILLFPGMGAALMKYSAVIVLDGQSYSLSFGGA